ncbi:lipopolysaccharide biosynthesis protein [Cohnella candidum]|uniref:Lipopolysaccharide biosynthesis protein n=1 Tax=Cohnella candidum TaxID=2674991 RepID=A0A3G3K025_9BACL|nr:lipopolysaccharide biosynthesis protein [Cohnella candidum]AYQ73850.1 lipopolysaccharide biosynthesis protein [Cohnella candidum]
MSVARSSLWAIAQSVSTQIAAMAGSVVLARLLSPEAFGLLGMATIFTGLVAVIQEVGMGSYLIYKQQASPSFIPTANFMNLAISAVLTLILVLGAKPISSFYGAAEVETIVYYIAAGVMLGSFGMTAKSYFQKIMKFRRLALTDLSAELLCTAAAIALALNGQTIPAITAKFLVRPALQTLILLCGPECRIFLRLRFDRAVVREMTGYSLPLILSQMLIYLSSVADYLVVGKTMGSRVLGLYTMAFTWAFLIRTYVSGQIARVMFSEFSRIQGDPAQIRNQYLRLMEVMAFALFPLCTGFCLLAPEFVATLYGDAWKEAVPPMRLLMAAGLASGLGTVSGALFKSLGRPDYELKLFSVMFVVTCGMLYAGSYFGILGVCAAVLAENLIVLVIRSWLVAKLLKLAMLRYVACFVPSAASALGMAGVYLLATALPEAGLPAPVRLVVWSLILSAVYLALSRFLNRPAYRMVKQRLFPIGQNG